MAAARVNIRECICQRVKDSVFRPIRRLRLPPVYRATGQPVRLAYDAAAPSRSAGRRCLPKLGLSQMGGCPRRSAPLPSLTPPVWQGPVSGSEGYVVTVAFA